MAVCCVDWWFVGLVFDGWYEENKDNVDIGVIDFKLFKIDVFPDNLEKHMMV
jgi:hypothetical protein